MTDIEQHTTLTDRSVPTKNITVEDTQALSSQSSPSAEYEELAVVIAISAGEFSRRKLKKYIFSQIEDSTEATVLIIDGVKPSWGRDIFDSLKDHRTRSTWNVVTENLTIKIMPSWIHDCIQPWWVETVTQMSITGLMTSIERRQIRTFMGTTLEFQSGPYMNSRKEPDLFVIPKLAVDSLPSVAFEVGWSESHKKLKADVDLLLTGGDGSINVVVVVKWKKHRLSQRVHGFADVYVRDVFGIPVLRQHEVIFPASLVLSIPVLNLPVLLVPTPIVATGPTHRMATRSSTRPPAPLPAPNLRPPPPSPPLPTGGPQRLIFSHEEVFGPTFLQDPACNGPPPATIDLEINLLREFASECLQEMNLQPAV
ncbi:hypothetical protein N7495_008752 [Penicillium taxi]|uniref:uncharacterized protein n=1 Tax=Penicillium taxi TaxID=168475 RepID=UPI0025451CCA|nr:uncharacterized protein N7495_008752 [Penicillium taxi]KAJ5888711.1 hypothetical protein N7495_008752 [Penicillium taxi]